MTSSLRDKENCYNQDSFEIIRNLLLIFQLFGAETVNFLVNKSKYARL